MFHHQLVPSGEYHQPSVFSPEIAVGYWCIDGEVVLGGSGGGYLGGEGGFGGGHVDEYAIVAKAKEGIGGRVEYDEADAGSDLDHSLFI